MTATSCPKSWKALNSAWLNRTQPKFTPSASIGDYTFEVGALNTREISKELRKPRPGPETARIRAKTGGGRGRRRGFPPLRSFHLRDARIRSGQLKARTGFDLALT